MKKEIKNAVITILFMSVITVLSLVVVSVCAFKLKWKSELVMQGITVTYIVTGLTGGLLFGRLSHRDFSIRNKRVGVLRSFLYGIVLASLYWAVPGGIMMFFYHENISHMGQFAVCWGLMAGSITAGVLLVTGGKGSRHMRRKT